MNDTTYHASETLERIWNAPIETVWELWTTSKGFETWHGPVGFRTDVQVLEPRAGGKLAYTMTVVGEQQVAAMESKGRPLSWPAEATFTEVVQHERIVFELVMPMGPDHTTILLHTVTFEQTDEGVRMVFRIDAEAQEMLQGAVMGYRSSLERMAAALGG